MDFRIMRGIYSLLVGILITLLSGIFQTPFARILVVAQMGAPLTWMTRVIPSSLIHVDWINFITDWAFWLIIVYVVIAVVNYLRHREVKKL